jgi:hypothetical protein
VPRQQLAEFPDVDFSDPRVKWADMTGDGLQDIVFVHNSLIEYWPSLGYGTWGKRIDMSADPSLRFPYGYDPKRVLLGDVDGDGRADLTYVPARRLTPTDSDISSVTGPCRSTPLSHDPVAGVLLLSGVGAWPPPDGVGCGAGRPI